VKIRNRTLIGIAGKSAALSLRALVGTLRYEDHSLADEFRPKRLPPTHPHRYLYSIWHENLLLPTVMQGDPSLAVLISKHADGQLLGELITAMGMSMVQGSTNRGGVEAVRKLVDPAAAFRHVAITPDGPRGPRRIVQPGMIYAASRAAMPIICIGVGYHNPWRAGSWDRFAIPKPCTRAKLIAAVPITVPAGLRSAELEIYRGRVQAEMEHVNAMAESWAMTNRLAGPAAPRQYRAAA
jgi:lysophospholipid acyltransferase (LPLAT)-like uncharacterized protein